MSRPPLLSKSVPQDVQRRSSSLLLRQSELEAMLNDLHSRGLARSGLPPRYDAAQIHRLLATASVVLSRESNCLQVSSPMLLFGDLHGEFHTLVKLLDVCGRPPQQQYLFLGDYVDRGAYSLEVVMYLLLIKILHPNRVHLLRGNHEDRRIYRFFNFEDDLIAKFGSDTGQSLSKCFHRLFCLMPVCAVLNREVFCCHGGISPHFNHPDFAVDLAGLIGRVNALEKPLNFRKSDFVADLLWSDALDSVVMMPRVDDYPSDVEELLDRWSSVCPETPTKPKSSCVNAQNKTSRLMRRFKELPIEVASFSNAETPREIEWAPNARGCSFVFTRAACERFLRKYCLKLIIRAHMFAPIGYKFDFDGLCLTLFSAADYAQRFSNPGAILYVGRPASKSSELPGSLHTFHKRRLLSLSKRLPEDPSQWPQVIA